jgi:hypothetical protein
MDRRRSHNREDPALRETADEALLLQLHIVGPQKSAGPFFRRRAQAAFRGPEIVAIHPTPNENAWLLGQVAMCEGTLVSSEDVGLVGARGVTPTLATWMSRWRSLASWWVEIPGW